MPEIVTEPVVFSASRGRASQVDWAAHFTTYAGKVVKFTQGADFDMKPSSFAVAAQAYAKRFNLGAIRTSVPAQAEGAPSVVLLKFPTAAENAAAKSQAAELEGQEAIKV